MPSLLRLISAAWGSWGTGPSHIRLFRSRPWREDEETSKLQMKSWGCIIICTENKWSKLSIGYEPGCHMCARVWWDPLWVSALRPPSWKLFNALSTSAAVSYNRAGGFVRPGKFHTIYTYNIVKQCFCYALLTHGCSCNVLHLRLKIQIETKFYAKTASPNVQLGRFVVSWWLISMEIIWLQHLQSSASTDVTSCNLK